MSFTNITCFIFGAFTYQIPFIFFKHIFHDQKVDLLKENFLNRKNISCLDGQNSREKRFAEQEVAFEELEEKPVLPILENFSESALNRSWENSSLKQVYNPRNKSSWNYFSEPYLEAEECSCDRKKYLFPSYNYKDMFDDGKNPEYQSENQIRKDQYENYLRNHRFTEMAYPLITRTPFNFIEVPTFGITLHPTESVILPIKFHLKEKEIIKVDLNCQFCEFSQDLGNDWKEVAETNLMMEKMRFLVKVYDARPVTDIVTLTVVRKLTGETQKAQFPGNQSFNKKLFFTKA